jgi:hypothetical protein
MRQCYVFVLSRALFFFSLPRSPHLTFSRPLSLLSFSPDISKLFSKSHLFYLTRFYSPTLSLSFSLPLFLNSSSLLTLSPSVYFLSLFTLFYSHLLYFSLSHLTLPLGLLAKHSHKIASRLPTNTTINSSFQLQSRQLKRNNIVS